MIAICIFCILSGIPPHILSFDSECIPDILENFIKCRLISFGNWRVLTGEICLWNFLRGIIYVKIIYKEMMRS